MTAHKRTRTGQIKPQNHPDIAMADATPPCARPLPPPSSKSTETQQLHPTPSSAPPKTTPLHQAPSKPPSAKKPPKTHHNHKMAKLPSNAHLSKRPLLHPALPTPFASAAAPKVIYVTASTPYIPCLKRVRRLLAETDKRAKQSLAATSRGGRGRGGGGGRSNGGYIEANGKLNAGAVEKGIVDGVREADGRIGVGVGGSKGGEQVFLKATGRAIARALEVGVYFQGEGEYRVSVELGSVRAVDDIEITSPVGQQADDADDDVPETRIRTLSSVTVGIGMV